MVHFLKPIALGMTTAMLLCGTALVGTAGAAGQTDKQPALQQQNSGPPTAAEDKQRKAPVASPRTFTSTERVEARAAELEKKLRITAEQKPQWDKVVTAMRDNAEAIEDVIAHRRQNAGKMTAIEDLRSYQTLSEKHAEGLRNMVAAFEPLYGAMTPQQKKLADNEFGGYRKRVSSTAAPSGTAAKTQ